jgi:tetratricopeptide (TPR) repeat protein
MELGDYEGAAAAFAEIQRRGGNVEGSVNTETRLARLSLLRGNTDEATSHFATALVSARALDPVPRETVAWCYWQLGETAFLVGKYDVAEKHYRDSLTTFPDYYRAVASLGRVLAAEGDTAGAIAQYEAVVRRLPDPIYVASLGDLYKVAGRDKDAAAQYDLVEQIAHLSERNGVLYNRNLALFYADHDMKPDVAYENARREYETRKDVYGADALAWAALKAGKVDEARAAIGDALALGTRDPRLFYHAGMIAKAAGDAAGAKDYLGRALEMSPQFDPLQAPIARQALAGL